MSNGKIVEEKNKVEGGKLYLVATPIGNLSDISERAVKTLSEVDFIAAEDTRHTLGPLNHLNIEKRIGRGVTYHIAPSNVPVNFAVSMTSALLAGKACVIRVSNTSFDASPPPSLCTASKFTT